MTKKIDPRSMLRGMLTNVSTAAVILPIMGGAAFAASCPTVSDSMGLQGEFPQQLEVGELKSALKYAGNPMFDGKAPAVADRLPAEPLVVLPYEACGVYGGTLHGLSNATEAGTSDLLSIRHVNLVRYADDLKTIVPNIAKSWSWNGDFTELTINLRKGHKWSDGAAFTTADIKFWYEDLILNKDVFPETPSRWLFGGEPMKMEAVSDTQLKITLAVPTPGLLNRFAVDFAQPFQPKHFLGQFHAKYNAKADEMAKAKGKKNWVGLVNEYYGGSDWKDVPSPLLDGFDSKVVPTLESYILVEESSEHRRLVANPYFHMVDSSGQQLPYINQIDERYVPDKEVRNLKITNGEVTYKTQAVSIEDFPLYKENEGRGGFKVALAKGLGETIFYSFNRTHKDPVLRGIFSDPRFSKAMSVAINREEAVDLVFLGQAEPQQAMPMEPATVSFIEPKKHLLQYTEFDPKTAKSMLAEMGLNDSDGDGIVERPDGKPLAIRIQYSNQGGPVKLHELVQGYWQDVGLKVDLKEVTSDEYRAQGNNNDLDVTTWKNDGTSAPTVSQNMEPMVPPFGDFFNPGTGHDWAAWKTSNGAQGIEPPADVKELWKLSASFIQQPLNTAASNEIGKKIADIHATNLFKIGVAGNVRAPYVHRNDLKNFKAFTAKTYDYYWAYPYRPAQWYLQK